jgi:hypothetical protein
MSASNPQLDVLICIIGAAGYVTNAYAISRLYGKNSEDDTAPHTLHDQQRAYMRDVRMHNRMLAEQEAMEGRRGKRPGHFVTEAPNYT